MRKIVFTLFFLLPFTAVFAQNQAYNIVIKGGHVIDPKNNMDGLMDVAIKDGKIALVAKNIDEKQGIQVVNAKGLYVTPGIIDIHTHHFYGTNMDQTYMNGPNAFPPDGFTFRNGVTTVVDAGSPGWRTFSTYKRQTIDASKTRVLAFLNISGEGMRGGNYEQNTNDMDAKLSANTARQYKDYIVGFKVAHFEGPDWTPVDRAVEAGKLAGDLPVMIDFGGSTPPLSIEELFTKHLRPGDIFTHAFGQLASREYIVDINSKKVKPFVLEAQKRGIVFDVGYGGISFAFSQAVPAVASKFYPNTISTDIHIGSMNEAMKDMLTTMSKFMAMGMDLSSVIKASTWTPAQVINHEELGHLSVGAVADVAILGVRKGKFGLFDYTGYKIDTDKKLECELTVRDGKVVYNLNGITTPVVLPRTATTPRPATQTATTH